MIKLEKRVNERTKKNVQKEFSKNALNIRSNNHHNVQ